MKLKNIQNKIKDDLSSILNIKEIYQYPFQGVLKKSPSVIFFIDNVDNTFETTAENLKMYNFKLFAVTNVAGLSDEKIYAQVIPDLYDSIVEFVDENWNFGTFEGHRMYSRISLIGFGISVEEKSKQATLDFTLQIKMLKNN
jgi:hypothetical protein